MGNGHSQGQNVLITGASGFIGGHLVDEGLSRGMRVYAAVRKTSNTDHLKKSGIELFPFDLNDQGAFREELTRHVQERGGFDFVIHNAGITKVRQPGDFERGNGYMSAAFAQALVDTQPSIKKFIYMSSIAALGPGDPVSMLPIDEEQYPNPITPYGKSKLLGEQLLADIQGLPYLFLRPSAVYGPRDKKFLEMVSSMFRKGIDIRLGSSQQRLSFVHVADLVRIVFDSAISSLEREAFNISDGNSYQQSEFNKEVIKLIDARAVPVRIPKSVLHVIGYANYAVLSAIGRPVHLSQYKMKEVTAKNWVINIAKAESLLGYRPKFNLKSGLEDTFENERGPQ